MFRQRILVGVPLSLLAIAAFVLPGVPGALVFFGLSSALLLLAVNEFFRMTASLGRPGCPRIVSLFAVVFLAAIALADTLGAEGLVWLPLAEVALHFGLIATLLLLLLRRPPGVAGIDRFAVSVAGYLYIFWCLSFVPRIYYLPNAGMAGRYLTLYLMFVTKIADVGAYLVGTASSKRAGGNHKLVPTLSPKKSWEGLAGGIVASVLLSLLLTHVWADRMVLNGERLIGLGGGLFFGVFCPLAGLAGDLIESYLKRASGSKDSGHIPGLGGALDILDSVIPTAPVFYAYLYAAGALC